VLLSVAERSPPQQVVYQGGVDVKSRPAAGIPITDAHNIEQTVFIQFIVLFLGILQ
jgi:hypothetical protein